MSNKDSYSYYTESVCGITTTNQSQIIKEEFEDEVVQVEIMEIGSPKINNDLLGFAAAEPDSKQSSPSVTDCQKPGSFAIQMQPTDGWAMFDASPVGRSPRQKDPEETKSQQPSKSRNSETSRRNQS